MSAPSSFSARSLRRVRRSTLRAGKTFADVALLQAARLRRLHLGNTTFIAVTGSCGKSTSTKLIRAILARNGACVAGERNNTEKAAVRAVLTVPATAQFCLQEVGADE